MPSIEKSAEHIRALQESHLINSDLTLREISQAAQKIPGIGDGGAALAWELITRDFVFRGLAGRGVVDTKTIAALEQSKILNFDITLGEIMKMAERIPGFDDANPAAAWELVSRDFVLRGMGTINTLDV